jgi:hypothetical protein
MSRITRHSSDPTARISTTGWRRLVRAEPAKRATYCARVCSPGPSVTVDNVALETQVLVPSDWAMLSGSAVLDASGRGTGDVTGVEFVVTGGALSNQVVGTASATLYGWVTLWDTTSVPNGSYRLDSVATEVGGTTATSTGITVTVNNAA